MKELTFRKVLFTLLLLSMTIFITNEYLFSITDVSGYSMEETIHDGDRMLLNKISPYDRFDIIVFEKDNGEHLIKRLIGLPGDHISYVDDQLYINGKKYDEPYLDKIKEGIIAGHLTEDFSLIDYTGYDVIPKGYYFVLGDNRRYSIDSRIIGLIPEEKLLGKTSLILAPTDRFGFVE